MSDFIFQVRYSAGAGNAGLTIQKGQRGRHTWVVLGETVVIAVGLEEVLERWG